MKVQRHLGLWLGPRRHERAANDCMMVCISRSLTRDCPSIPDADLFGHGVRTARLCYTSGMPTDFEALLSPAVKVRSLDDVVFKLREILLSGRVAVGDRLPSERELSRILSVSRTTVREALRTLEANGLVAIRLGGTGGAFFTGPDAGLVGSALSTLLLFESATEQDLNEFRFDFEQVNAELAARRATAAQRRALQELLARAQAAGAAMDWVTIETLDLEVHELLPVLTQNSVTSSPGRTPARGTGSNTAPSKASSSPSRPSTSPA